MRAATWSAVVPEATDARFRLFIRADLSRLLQLARRYPDGSRAQLVTARAEDHLTLYDFASGYVS